MDQLMLSLVLSIGAARILSAVNKPDDTLSTAIQPPLPLTPQRLELIKALTKGMSRSPNERIAQTPSQKAIIAQKEDRPNQLLLVLPKKIWVLLIVLIFVALLPNFTLAPLLWLRFFDRPASTAATIPAHQSSMADQSISATEAILSANRSSIADSVLTPVLSAPSLVEVAVGQDVSLPIALDGTDEMPPSSRIVIKGLPPGSKLSGGHPDSNSEWNLNPDEIGDLHFVLGNNTIRDTKLAIHLVAPDGRVIADTATILKITKPQASVMPAGTETQQTATQLSSGQPQRLEVIETTEPVHPETAVSTTDSTPLPTLKPQAENHDDTKWIRPSTSVNLRKGPSSSAAIINVVERDTKLRALARKKGWVQVTNPATSETGWIYAGNIGSVR